MAPGRRRFVPTADDRKLVRGWTAFGIPQPFIIAQVKWAEGAQLGQPIGERTFQTVFRDEIRDGKANLIADAGAWVVTHMRGRPAIWKEGKIVAKEIEPDLKAALFILETQGKDYGWAKRSELTGADGSPFGGPWDLSRLDENEVRVLKALAVKALPAPDAG